MRKVLRVAWRDFVATVFRKSFLVGILVVPLVAGVMILVLPSLVNEQAPDVAGHVAVLDRSGAVADELRAQLKVEAMAANQDRPFLPSSELAGAASVQLELDVVVLDDGVSVDEEKAELGARAQGDRLALIVVHPDAVRKTGAAFGSYDLFVREKLDDRVEREIRDAVRRSIIQRRILASDLDPNEVHALMKIERVESTVITERGERASLPVFNALLPAAFMLLLLVTVLSGGAQLMTTTIEEKSNRIVEVLLSAVSPMELMAGKILGQLWVGLVVLVIYGGMGMVAAASFALQGLIDPWLLLYLLIFYLISYFVVGAFMAAIGAAVTDLRDAQSLMRPVMIVLMLPWLVWMPIARDPNAPLAVVASFVPPINTFGMLLRMCSVSPPPWWQVWLSIGIGVLSAYASLWFAAKVFRIGLLEFGKAPDLRTLVRWVRQA